MREEAPVPTHWISRCIRLRWPSHKSKFPHPSRLLRITQYLVAHYRFRSAYFYVLTLGLYSLSSLTMLRRDIPHTGPHEASLTIYLDSNSMPSLLLAPSVCCQRPNFFSVQLRRPFNRRTTGKSAGLRIPKVSPMLSRSCPRVSGIYRTMTPTVSNTAPAKRK